MGALLWVRVVPVECWLAPESFLPNEPCVGDGAAFDGCEIAVGGADGSAGADVDALGGGSVEEMPSLDAFEEGELEEEACLAPFGDDAEGVADEVDCAREGRIGDDVAIEGGDGEEVLLTAEASVGDVAGFYFESGFGEDLGNASRAAAWLEDARSAEVFDAEEEPDLLGFGGVEVEFGALVWMVVDAVHDEGVTTCSGHIR